MNILVIYKALWGSSSLKKSVNDHLRMFDGVRDDNDILYWNIADGVPFWLGKCDFDVIVLHTTFLSIRYGDNSLFKHWKKKFEWLGSHSALKIAFPQDERYYNLELIDWLASMRGVLHLYSVFGHDKHKCTQIYSHLSPNINIYPCLTGYINENDLDKPASDWKDRNIDVFYRAKRLPPWVGRYGQLKSRIGEKLNQLASTVDLKINSSIEKQGMLLGETWIEALRDSKYIVGCQAGGSAIDERGEITEFIKNYRKNHGGKDPTFSEIDKQFSSAWDSYEFFAMGPRNLEAVVTRTCQILVEGSYSEILKPNLHYIPIKSDLSDLETVLHNLSDVEGEAIAERAYNDLCKGEKKLVYSSFANMVLDNAIKDLSCFVERKNRSSFKLSTLRSINLIVERMPLFQLPNLFKLWVIKKYNARFFSK